MPLFAISSDKIVGEILYDLSQNTPIRRTSPGSKARTIADAVGSKLGRAYKQFDLNLVQSFLNGAVGKYLDLIGEMLGCSRLGKTPAAAFSTERNVRFYVDTGTFGSINGGNSILITKGTLVATESAGAGISYIVPYNVILSSTLSEVFVGVQASRSGSVNNVGPKQLIYHNFTNYTDSGSESLRVRNEADIANGQDGEIDANYRYRIANQTLVAEKANATAVRLAALIVPGVADIVMLPFFRGIGTYDLLIKATTPLVSDGLIAAVQESIDRVTAQGIIGTARSPQTTGLSLTGTLTLKKKLPVDEQTNILNAATANVTDYTNSLDIGEDWIVNEVVQRVMAVSDNIKNLGSANKPLDSAYIYKDSKLQDNRVRGTLIGDYAPETDERIIVEVESGGNTPILFLIK
jgi:uncharacterized phage protein gp47/JayE